MVAMRPAVSQPTQVLSEVMARMRYVTVHVFVDESRRRDTYLLAAAYVKPADLASTRRDLRQLLLPGQRELHLNRESPKRRRQIVDAVVRTNVRVRIYQRNVQCRDEEAARQGCLRSLVRDALDVSAHRLVFDTRQSRDVRDEQTIYLQLTDRPSSKHPSYEHLDSVCEPLFVDSRHHRVVLRRQRTMAEQDPRDCRMPRQLSQDNAKPGWWPSDHEPGSLHRPTGLSNINRTARQGRSAT